MSERRRAERVKVALDAHWEGVLAQCSGTVVDLSVTGCFILTPDQVRTKELIRVEMVSPTGGLLYLWGEVVYQVHEMGFALRFTGSDADIDLTAHEPEFSAFQWVSLEALPGLIVPFKRGTYKQVVAAFRSLAGA